jgi:hypothetical protein
VRSSAEALLIAAHNAEHAVIRQAVIRAQMASVNVATLMPSGRSGRMAVEVISRIIDGFRRPRRRDCVPQVVGCVPGRCCVSVWRRVINRYETQQGRRARCSRTYGELRSAYRHMASSPRRCLA